MRQQAEGLDAGDHARHRAVLAQGGLDGGSQRARGHPAEEPQPAAVVYKLGPQALGQRQHHLAVRDRDEQVLIRPQARLAQPPRVAQRAEVPALAVERRGLWAACWRAGTDAL